MLVRPEYTPADAVATDRRAAGSTAAAMAFAAVTLILLAAPALAQVPLAITIDDVPWNGVEPLDGAAGGTDRLLATLMERGIQATGFVVCNRMEDGAPIVRAWLAAGMDIGNHSAAHRDLNSGMRLWLDDARRCESQLAAITGKRGGFFRYPYLHQGPTAAIRDEVADALAGMSYRTAHVTIDNSEWILARAYGRALQVADERTSEEIGNAYVAHVLDAARHFRRVAREKFGRDVAQVLLVHANALNADWLGEVLDSLTAEDFTFVSLEVALRDPVFSLPDAYAGRRGLSWLYRAAPLSQPDPWDEAAEDALVRRFGE